MNSKIKKQLWIILEDNTTKRGRYFDYFIQTLILLSLASFSIDTLPDLSKNFRTFLEVFETTSIAIFSVEYLLRVYVSKNPLKYIFSFYGIIDILSILPFYLSKFLDLRFLRAFRIFRIFRALKLMRYNKALNRFRLGFLIVKEEIILFFLVTLVLIFITSAGIYFFENEAQQEVLNPFFTALGGP